MNSVGTFWNIPISRFVILKSLCWSRVGTSLRNLIKNPKNFLGCWLSKPLYGPSDVKWVETFSGHLPVSRLKSRLRPKWYGWQRKGKKTAGAITKALDVKGSSQNGYLARIAGTDTARDNVQATSSRPYEITLGLALGCCDHQTFPSRKMKEKRSRR